MDRIHQPQAKPTPTPTPAQLPTAPLPPAAQQAITRLEKALGVKAVTA